MRYFLDTEFIEDGKTIDLISIAFVCEDGRHLYRGNAECDLNRANEWVQKNVIPILPTKHSEWSGEFWCSRETIKNQILGFMPPDSKPEIWAYFADYDWVAFCQLFGRMIDLPNGYPKWCRDLKQLMWHLQVDRPPKSWDKEHDALADARWNKDLFEKLAKRAGCFSDVNLIELRI